MINKSITFCILLCLAAGARPQGRKSKREPNLVAKRQTNREAVVRRSKTVKARGSTPSPVVCSQTAPFTLTFLDSSQNVNYVQAILDSPGGATGHYSYSAVGPATSLTLQNTNLAADFGGQVSVAGQMFAQPYARLTTNYQSTSYVSLLNCAIDGSSGTCILTCSNNENDQFGYETSDPGYLHFGQSSGANAPSTYSGVTMVVNY